MNQTLLDAVRQSLVGKFDPEWVEEALTAADAVPADDDHEVYMRAVETALVTVFYARITERTARADALNEWTDLQEEQLRALGHGPYEAT